jgi:hypothetical protein
MTYSGLAWGVVLAGCGLIAFLCLRPQPKAPKPRCYFDGMVAIVPNGSTMVELGGDRCTGDAVCKYVYLLSGPTALTMRDLPLCTGHAAQAERLVAALELTAGVARG